MSAESWQLIGIFSGLLTLWAGFILGVQKWMNEKSVRRLEREFLEHCAKLPLEYVRKEDAIRQEVVINAKLDALAMKIDRIGAKDERD